MEKEEGEMSDCESMTMSVDGNNEINDESFELLYRSERGELIVEKLGKTDAIKLEERAKRFGINLTGKRNITQKQIDELYNNFQIKNGDERHFRFDTLHIRGVDGLNTKEIFEYLEEYKPISIEWISKTSCNVVCHDHISTALALLVHTREIENKETKDMVTSNSSYHWREGVPHPKKDLILFRFATKSDKKDALTSQNILPNEEPEKLLDKGKNPWGDLCQTWGVNDHQEIFNRRLSSSYGSDDNTKPIKAVQVKNINLAKRLGKRSKKAISDDSGSDSEWKRKTKTPRMRMHADDEELKEKKVANATKPKHDNLQYTPLSIEINNSEENNQNPRSSTKLSDKFANHLKHRKDFTVKEEIQSRLGPFNREDSADNDSLSDHSDSNITSKVHKIKSDHKNSNVWSRLDKKSDNYKSRGDLRQMLKLKSTETRNLKETQDLRKKLKNPRKGRSPLRIEIDNEYFDK